MNHLSNPTLEQIAECHLNINAPGDVEVTVSEDKSILWVNVNGVCLLRLSQVKTIKIDQ